MKSIKKRGALKEIESGESSENEEGSSYRGERKRRKGDGGKEITTKKVLKRTSSLGADEVMKSDSGSEVEYEPGHF